MFITVVSVSLILLFVHLKSRPTYIHKLEGVISVEKREVIEDRGIPYDEKTLKIENESFNKFLCVLNTS
jgi:hypothetical protein